MPTDYDVGQLFYMVVKKYGLPVRNHTHVKSKITALKREIPELHAKHYLATLLRRDLRTETGDYKPVLTEALDVYTKRVKIEDYLRRHKPVKVWTPPTAQARAAAEALRQKQFEE